MRPSTLGSRIEQARRETGLTTQQLAERVGVRRKTVESWERDKSKPRSNMLTTVAGLLNVSVAWLLSGEPAFEWNRSS